MDDFQLLPVLYGGEIVAHAKVDAVDFERLSQYRWHLDKHTGYVVRSEKFYLHREVLGLDRGDGMVADHEKGDLLDCRRSELRVCPNGQADNLQNQRLSRRNSSGFRGVSKARSGKWRARCRIGDVEHYLGTYRDREEAASVARAFRRDHMPFST